MIDPYTPSGTKIVCIDNQSGKCQVPGRLYTSGLHGLELYRVYTVDHIYESSITKSKFGVAIKEIDRTAQGSTAPGYDISRFKPAVLPEEITSALNVVKQQDKIDA